MSAICAGLGSKGKVGVQRGRETAGVPSFLPPRRVPRRSRRPQTANPPRRGYGESPRSAERNSLAEPQRKTPRPSGTNTLAQFASPAQPVLKKLPPVRDESPPLWFSTANKKHRRPPVRGVLFYSISSRTEKAASCSVLSSLYSISREYALQMQICAQCVTSPLASHSYTSSS